MHREFELLLCIIFPRSHFHGLIWVFVLEQSLDTLLSHTWIYSNSFLFRPCREGGLHSLHSSQMLPFAFHNFSSASNFFLQLFIIHSIICPVNFSEFLKYDSWSETFILSFTFLLKTPQSPSLRFIGSRVHYSMLLLRSKVHGYSPSGVVHPKIFKRFTCDGFKILRIFLERIKNVMIIETGNFNTFTPTLQFDNNIESGYFNVLMKVYFISYEQD